MEIICEQCNKTFSLNATEIENHHKLSPIISDQTFPLPLPRLCNDCSNQLRFSWLNFYTLYNRACDSCAENVISMYKPEAKYTIYCNPCYLKQKNVDQDYDVTKDFFQQFNALLHSQPLPALSNDNNTTSTNCAYTNYSYRSQNCYFTFASVENQDCYYCYATQESKDSADASYCVNVELCYEVINCHGCYHSAYLIGCRLSNECYFSYDLNNCHHCIFSSGLRNKEYYIHNKPYSKDEYESYASKLQTSSWIEWQKLAADFDSFYANTIRKNVNNRHCENCTGNDLQYSKNTSGFFMYKGEDCRNLISANTCKNVDETYKAGQSELCYQSLNLRQCYNVIGSAFCSLGQNVFYSFYTRTCKNIFGCIGLIDKEYCILNKQYSKEAYEKLVPVIIESMIAAGTLGRFFPSALSPFDYDETIANDIFPTAAIKVPASETTTITLPDNTQDTDITITKEAISCQVCAKFYRVTEQELALYQKLKVAIPRSCFRCRHKSRSTRRPSFRLYATTCSKCTKEIDTNYTPENQLTTYCEECYSDNVIIN